MIRYINDTMPFPHTHSSVEQNFLASLGVKPFFTVIPMFTAICFGLFWRFQVLFSQQARKQVNKEDQGGKKGRKEKRKQARSKVVAVLVVEVEVRHQSSNQLGQIANVKVHVTRLCVFSFISCFPVFSHVCLCLDISFGDDNHCECSTCGWTPWPLKCSRTL